MAKRIIDAVPLAPGVTTGVLQFLTPVSTGVTLRRDAPPELELARFQQQAAALRRRLEETAARLEGQSLAKEAEIVRGHALLLEDAEFQERVGEAIRKTEFAAEVAVENVLEGMADQFADSPFPGLADRAAELRDLSIQLRRQLAGERSGRLSAVLKGSKEPVLALPELLPSVVLEARRHNVRGLVVDRGTAYSHTAILARSFCIPAVRVSSLALLRSYAAAPVLVDGDRGEVVVAPDEQDLAQRARQAAQTPRVGAETALPVRLWASVLTPEELQDFDWQGVEGVGLYRTEALFMQQREDFPSEEEQIETYARLFALAGGRPVTVRTLDAGGDKMLAYLSFGAEDNPQLGLRAHRLFRFHPELLRVQVRAILRAAAGGRLRLMYPMIESLGQWRFVEELVNDARDSLRLDGVAHQDRFERGPLIETPSAVWSFSRLLSVSDFASAGTNDLVQYLFAVDRNNSNVAELYRPEDPVVLQILRTLAHQARESGKPLAICGEIAADARFLPVLVGLGIKDFSVAAARLREVRAYLDSLSLDDCRDLAARSTGAQDADEVDDLLSQWHGIRGSKEPVGAEVLDPVCGMALDPSDTPFSLVDSGQRYYFCSRRCRDRFATSQRSQSERDRSSTQEKGQ